MGNYFGKETTNINTTQNVNTNENQKINTTQKVNFYKSREDNKFATNKYETFKVL